MSKHTREQTAYAPRLPSVKSVMASKGCSAARARTIVSELAFDMDDAVFAKTGLHTLKPYSDLDEMWKDLAK